MFTKKIKYAIVITKYLSQEKKGTLMSAKEIAAALKFSKESTAKILQEMAKKKLISSRKGNGGGFFIKKNSNQITLEKIITVMTNQNHKSCIFNLPTIKNEKCPFCEIWSEFNYKLINKGKNYFA